MRPSLTASSNSADAKSSNLDAAQRGAIVSGTEYSADQPRRLRDIIDVIYGARYLLIFVPIIAGVLVYAGARFLPRQYTSLAFLSVNDETARSADTRMASAPLSDEVLTKLNIQFPTIEEGRRQLRRNRRIIVASGQAQKTATLFVQEVTSDDPKLAQQINAAFIDIWLESTKPTPDRRANIENEIQRLELQTNSIGELIDRLGKDTPSLVAQGSLQGELATPISALIVKRDQNLVALANLRDSLKGVSRDVVFGTPTLPQEKSWPNEGLIALLAATCVGIFLLMVVLFRRFVLPG